jgi:hypothetical protein
MDNPVVGTCWVPAITVVDTGVDQAVGGCGGTDGLSIWRSSLVGGWAKPTVRMVVGSGGLAFRMG